MTMQAWWELYQSAMVELNPAELQARIEDAKIAVNQRMEELSSRNDLESIEERQKLYQAHQNLHTLQRLECSGPRNAAPAPRQESAL